MRGRNALITRSCTPSPTPGERACSLSAAIWTSIGTSEKGTTGSQQIGFSRIFEGQRHFVRLEPGDSRGFGDENLSLFERSITHFAGTGSGILVPYFRALRAQTLSERGDIPESLALLQEAVELVDTFGEASHAAEIQRIRATVLLHDGSSKPEKEHGVGPPSICSPAKAQSWNCAPGELMRD